MRHSIFGSLLAAVALVLLVLTGGCGGVESGLPKPPPQKRVLPQPVLQMVAPTAVSAGDVVTIVGRGFADPQVGETRLTFSGVFQSTAGNSEQVEVDVRPIFKNQGELEWTFGPNIPFSSRNETGTFRGFVKATNVGRDGVQKDATPLSTQMQVRPSIVLKQFRPVSAGCQAGITDTTADTKMFIEVEAVGLKAGNSTAPLRFVYTFMKEHFQFEGYFDGQLGLDPEALFPKTGPVSIISDVLDGSISRLGTGVPSTTYVHQGSSGSGGLPTGLDKLFKLANLRTAPLANAQANNAKASISIMAIDSTGQMIKRRVPLTIWTAVEVNYNGGFKEVRSFDPVPVSGCISGGDVGYDVIYTESVAETRSRSFTVRSDVSGGFDIKVVRLNASFGVDVNATVSSSKSKDLRIKGYILPHQFAAFYRQTLQIERTAKLRVHGPCGATSNVGSVVVTDWVWSPDLAKGKTCPPLPKSNLPAGETFK